MKARKIKEFLGYSGRIDREGLLSVWGMGEETVDSILLYAYDVPVFVADAYARRVFSRVGLCGEGASYGEVQGLVHSAMPRDYKALNEYHALLVEHAKRHCRAKPECAGCPLVGLCKNRRMGPQ
jgi:endonuclease-3 related protein